MGGIRVIMRAPWNIMPWNNIRMLTFDMAFLYNLLNDFDEYVFFLFHVFLLLKYNLSDGLTFIILHYYRTLMIINLRNFWGTKRIRSVGLLEELSLVADYISYIYI